MKPIYKIYGITLHIPTFRSEIPEGEEKEGYWKCIWRNYGWKLLKPKQGIRYPDTRSTEDSK